ncbi:uncharacterized protein LOC110608948 [Manihot esculenta]|uniref:uncharacterized protein LOC110608948 n=1 Tax=Manihot esculenta TaxID=3983 RepID=UPI000B5D6C43|nr:uncharacterized protein LOC110608948 [Manihot esculenta]
MATYYGAGNLREHILNCKTFIELQTLSDALMCKVFPMTLIGPVRAWFNSMEAGSIRSFGDLTNVFISRFIAGVPAERKTSYLETVWQRKNESLREKPSTTLAELMKRAEKYIRQDDALTTSRFAREVADRGKAIEKMRSKRSERRHNKGPEVYRQPWDRREQRPYPPRVPKAITPLNASKAKVLMAVQDKDFLLWSKPMKADASRRDPDKYCQYHRTHGHDTNSCYQLINEIERLIKRGHLRNFVKNPEGERP